jgi:hypothetical protein
LNAHCPLIWSKAQCRWFVQIRIAANFGHVTVEYQGEALVWALSVFECSLPLFS